MPKKLISLSIPNPGINGLNFESSQAILGPEWATIADNMVFDNTGRLASRKGSRRINASTCSEDIVQIHEYIDATATKTIILATDTKIYKVSGTTLTDISGTATINKGNWKFVNFNGKCVGFQQYHDPIVLSSTSSTFAKISLSGTNQPSANVDEVVAIGGRLYVIDQTDILASDSLDETSWNTVAVDLTANWLYGMDTGVALAEFNGNLVIFGKNNIVIYSDPYDPTASDFIKIESIGGVGCIARDSIQEIRGDLWFLSAGGVMPLGRVIQEKSMPIGEISKNIRLHLIGEVNEEDSSRIRSTYSQENGFYLLALPNVQEIYCFDTRISLGDGSARVTKWDMKYTALCTATDQTTYMGKSGYLVKYFGYLDDILYDNTGGSTYTVDYRSGWTDFGQEASGYLKIPKTINTKVLGANGQTLTTYWAYDFDDLTTYTATATIPAAITAVYGTAVYGTATYGTVSAYYNAKESMSRTGQALLFGIQTTVNNSIFALQRINVQTKIGKMVA